MSKKNRQQTYNKLVNSGRLAHIDPSLVEEFGDPNPKPKKEKKSKVTKWLKK